VKLDFALGGPLLILRPIDVVDVEVSIGAWTSSDLLLLFLRLAGVEDGFLFEDD